MPGALSVKGLGDLNRALRVAEKDVRVGIRKELREVGKPVADEAQQLAIARISGLRKTNARPRKRGRQRRDWSKMRVGITTDLIYVVPQQRGTKTERRKRRDFAGLMMEKAMQPALDKHAAEVERKFNAMLFDVAAKFNR